MIDFDERCPDCKSYEIKWKWSSKVYWVAVYCFDCKELNLLETKEA